MFTADSDGIIRLGSLTRSDYSCILIGGEDGERDIVIQGTQGFRSKSHVQIASDYHGRVTLADAYLTAMRDDPCIELGEGCDVTLVLSGKNHLDRGGICVPKSSTLRIEGDGDISIYLDAQSCYGIGNDLSSPHGPLTFAQDGAVDIHMNGTEGVCIGSGSGGAITIERGSYDLVVNCERGVGIGAFRGHATYRLHDCSVKLHVAVIRGCGAGVMDGECFLDMNSISLECLLECREGVACGVIEGSSTMHIADGGLKITMRGEEATGVGTLRGDTSYEQRRVRLGVVGHGRSALAFGGYEGTTRVLIEHSESDVELNTAMQKDTMAKPSDFRIISGINRFVVNGYEYPHEIEADA